MRRSYGTEPVQSKRDNPPQAPIIPAKAGMMIMRRLQRHPSP
ncbi:hypothetical protein SC1_02951 [Sphingopyxis sp. C-1]|nr:hypothetical protein SC1_02951 [Sphingopyxis sp. C-1]